VYVWLLERKVMYTWLLFYGLYSSNTTKNFLCRLGSSTPALQHLILAVLSSLCFSESGKNMDSDKVTGMLDSMIKYNSKLNFVTGSIWCRFYCRNMCFLCQKIKSRCSNMEVGQRKALVSGILGIVQTTILKLSLSINIRSQPATTRKRVRI
jgi:hypothetical protein